MPEYLLIGGENDGKREFIHQDQPCINMVIDKQESMPPASMGDVTESLTFESETYRKEKFCSNGETLHVFIIQGMSYFDAMRQLIRGYKYA